MDKQKVIIYSHGFGVRKDARGMFTDITTSMPGIEHVMFDYCEVDETNNVISVPPFARQVEKLNEVISSVKKNYPLADLSLISHSQGCVVSAMLNPQGMTKVILIAPPMTISKQKMIEVFATGPDAETSENGTMSFLRKDGSTTIITSEYLDGLEGVNPVDLFNQFAESTSLTIVKAKQDEIVDNGSDGLASIIKVIEIEGDHNFLNQYRSGLIETIKGSL